MIVAARECLPTKAGHRCVDPEASPAGQFNQGSSALTSATLTLRENGNVVETKNWTGNIATFAHSVVSFDNTNVTGTADYEVEISNPNGGTDANPLGNIQAESFSQVPTAPAALVTLELKTDNYCEETSWELRNSANTVVASFGPYTAGQQDNTVFTYGWALNPNDCYTFTINDAYGDGICCTYGNGYYKLKNTYGTAVVFQQGGQFGGEESKGFGTPATVGVQENGLNNGLSIYPNPTSGIVNLEFNENTTATVDVFNVLGERVMTSTFNTNGVRTIDLGALNNGVYYMNVTAGSLTATRKITLSK